MGVTPLPCTLQTVYHTGRQWPSSMSNALMNNEVLPFRLGRALKKRSSSTLNILALFSTTTSLLSPKCLPHLFMPIEDKVKIFFKWVLLFNSLCKELLMNGLNMLGIEVHEYFPNPLLTGATLRCHRAKQFRVRIL